MKKFCLHSLVFTFSFFVLSFMTVFGQMQSPPPDDDPPQKRPNFLRELNLTPPQIQQLRRLNQERKPLMMESRRRLEEANQALDEAIYADVENEAEIQKKIRAVQEAQAEMIKNRTQMERAIRRILTPEQLAHFRDLRERFNSDQNSTEKINDRRQNIKDSRRSLPRRPLRRNPPNQN